MTRTAYCDIDPYEMWTKHGRQLYGIGAYEGMIEASLAKAKGKPANSKYLDQLKKQMVEYLCFTYLERAHLPLDQCATMEKYAKQAMQIYSDPAIVQYWQGYLGSVKWVADLAVKLQNNAN